MAPGAEGGGRVQAGHHPGRGRRALSGGPVPEALLLAGAVAPILLLALALGGHRSWSYAGVFLLLLAVDALLTALPLVLPLNPPELRWNWAGKVLSIAWALAFVRFGPLTAGEAGLRLRQREGTAGPAALVTFAVIVLSAVLVGGAGRGDPETILYQATMPGLAEELVYRGVLLAVLARAFGRLPHAPERAPGSRRGESMAILFTALAFGLWHGLQIRGGSIAFDLMPFLFPFLAGLIWGWLRVYTGSLLFPILAHNGANAILYLIPR